MAKAERHAKMHDQELAYRALYKAQRAIKAMDPPESVLTIRLYELMAASSLTQKELLRAHGYILKAREIQLEISKAEYDKQFKRKSEAME